MSKKSIDEHTESFEDFKLLRENIGNLESTLAHVFIGEPTIYSRGGIRGETVVFFDITFLDGEMKGAKMNLTVAVED
jgi:hypothetical protein